MKKTYSSKTFAILLTLLVCYVSAANAWTNDISTLKDINSVCKLEPETQCTSAVRIGLNAPGVDMHNSSMTTMRLDNANLERANLSNSILQLTSLKGANLTLANLEGAHMHGVNLEKANLMMANLSKANLMDANLSSANLLGANLSGATLLKTRFDNAIWVDGKVCAVGSIGECL